MAAYQLKEPHDQAGRGYGIYSITGLPFWCRGKTKIGCC